MFFFFCFVFGRSLGLAVPPRVRFLNKAQRQKDEVIQEISAAADADSDEDIKIFKAQFRKDQMSTLESDEEEDEEEESDEEEEQVKSGGQLCSDDDDDEDLDLLTVKCKDVFNVAEEEQEEVNVLKMTTLMSTQFFLLHKIVGKQREYVKLMMQWVRECIEH